MVATNPSIDVEWRVRRFVPEEKNEVLAERRWPGGKGVNVARWLTVLGDAVRLVTVTGGATGAELCAGLKREGIRFRRVPLEAATRTNLIVTTQDQGQYRLNPTWTVLDPGAGSELTRVVTAEMRRCQRLVLTGALIRGAPEDLYAQWIQLARPWGCRVFLDCDGAAFRLAAASGPFLVKPNVAELEQWCGRTLVDEPSRLAAARELARVTGGWVLVSCGADGAFLVRSGSEDVWRSPARKVRVRNTVGAGDALLAGVVSASTRSDNPRVWLTGGMATAARLVRSEPGSLPAAVNR